MNQDILNACQSLYSLRKEGFVCILENSLGELIWDGEINLEAWELRCSYASKVKKGLKYHLFNLKNGKLEWLESYDSKNKKYDIPFNISDEDFLILAKKAHEQDITLNQLVVNLLQDYIENKRSIV
jgi:hypothetical protein